MKKTRRAKSLYQILAQDAKRRSHKRLRKEKIDLSKTIRHLREVRLLSGADLCRRAGDLDPRTLTAVEKGRIRNPSIQTLQSISRGLGVTLGKLFTSAETEMEPNLYHGSQKGSFQMEIPKWGVRMVSFTPLIKDFFCGKMILAPKKTIDHTLLKHPLPLFISALIGRFEIEVEDKQLRLKEGENLFFNGRLRHSFTNPLQRESVLLLITAPSFL